MNLNIKSLSLIFAIVIICAYIFGNVMVSVFKYKLDDYMNHSFKSNDLKEHFKSKESDYTSDYTSEEENTEVAKSDLSKILEEENKKNDYSLLHAEDRSSSKRVENNYIHKRAIVPENIQLNQNISSEEMYNTHINKKKDLVKEEDNYVIVKKKYVIENFNENKKNQSIIDNEFSKSFGSAELTNVNGYSQLEANNNNLEDNSAWNFDYEKHDAIKNLCFKNHIHSKECTYGHTNYADPRTMSIIEKRTFILNYPPNMTMQDYVNWLYCFIGKEDQLPYNHLKNLEKLKKGIKLVKEDGVCPPPAQYFPPIDSEKYFKNMYDAKSHEIAFAPKLNSNTSSLVGANYNQYSEFSQNFDVYGSTGSIVNPDIAYKKNAKDLDNIIKPKNGNDLDNEKKYKPYFVKNIEV